MRDLSTLLESVGSHSMLDTELLYTANSGSFTSRAISHGSHFFILTRPFFLRQRWCTTTIKPEAKPRITRALITLRDNLTVGSTVDRSFPRGSEGAKTSIDRTATFFFCWRESSVACKMVTSSECCLPNIYIIAKSELLPY